MGQACHLFNPLDPTGNTACSNPLSYVSADPNLRIADVQRIGAILFPEVPGTDPFWTAGGRGLFLGMALYVLETPSLPATLGEVLRQGMASDAEGFSAHWKRIIGGRQSGNFPLSSQCVRAISDIMDLAPVTASSIRKTFTSRLDLWANPLIDAATSRNDFDFRDLRKRPISIYIGIQPGDLPLLRPLLNLFIELAIAMQTRELPEHNPALTYQLLCLLDETTAPGRIPILAHAISYLPGYNVRLVLVIQAYSQLREVYGPNAADTMMKSLAARVLYAPKDQAEASEISQELGYTTVRVRSLSQPRGSIFATKVTSRGSVSVSEQRRPLLLPQEVKELGRDRELLLYEGSRPILAWKNRYFEDPFFRRRLLPPPQCATPMHVAARPAPAAVAPAPAAEAPSVAQPAPRRRATTPEDLEHIDQLTLEDFDIDFDRVVLPEKAEGERFTKAELDAAVDSFKNALRER
jgi:type IV secretion system protein VirD4